MIFNISDNGCLRVGDDVFMNDGVLVNVRQSVSIGDGCLIGQNVLIYDHDHDYRGDLRNGFVCKPVTIGEQTWVGSNVVILKGVTIGCGCVIAAGSVVARNVPDNTLYRIEAAPVMTEITR